MTRVLVRRAPDCLDIPLPRLATPGSAGLDLVAAEEIMLWPGDIVRVRTGLFLQIPEGFEGQIRPRSGLASKGVTIPNAPGTIDSDYRGEVQVLLTMMTDLTKPIGVLRIARGDRIAQLVIAPVIHPELVEVGELETTTRGAGGFGSTGR